MLLVSLIGVLFLSSCARIDIKEYPQESIDYNKDGCNCPNLSVTPIPMSLEELMLSSTDVVIATLIEQRKFGAYDSPWLEIEFKVQERLFGESPQVIFVYTRIDIQDENFSHDNEYLIFLREDSTIVTNFQLDAYFFTYRVPIINLNDIESSLEKNNLEEINIYSNISRELLLSNITSFITQMVPLRERPSSRYNIRSNDLYELVMHSPEIAIVEINEHMGSSSNCTTSADRFSVKVIESLKGDFKPGYEFKMIFFANTVYHGEKHIVAVSPGTIHPLTGLGMHFFTSRFGLFSTSQREEILSILYEN